MLIKTRNNSACVWFTLSHETSRISPRFMKELTKVVNAMKFHAATYWGLDEEASHSIKITKIDITVDMKGAFMAAKGH